MHDTITFEVPGTNTSIHPYYPVNAVIDGYVVNSLPTVALVSSFALGCAIILSSTYMLVRQSRPNLQRGDMAALLWFTLCGFIHFLFEGLSHRSLSIRW